MRCLIPLLCCLLLAPLSVAQDDAATLEELVQAGRLQIDSSVEPATGLVPGQRGRLVIEIATDRWFSGGTRIRIPEVPGLVILQTEQFAANASETRNGQSWVIQRWSLDLYPQRDGAFSIPGVELQLKVNGGAAGDIEGTLPAPAITFEVELPPALAQAGDEHWVAAPEFSVRQSFDRELDHLEVGDAFSREIQFEGSDLLAMMLPVFREAEQAGLAAYPDPPQLANRSNRGQAIARRVQRINYLVESGGQYRLPAQEYLWWDTGNGELKLAVLPAIEFEVAGGTGVRDSASPLSPRQLASYALGVTLLLGAGWLAYRLLPALPWQRLGHYLQQAWQLLQQLRKPALPARLNPDNSAAD